MRNPHNKTQHTNIPAHTTHQRKTHTHAHIHAHHIRMYTCTPYTYVHTRTHDIDLPYPYPTLTLHPTFAYSVLGHEGTGVVERVGAHAEVKGMWCV